MLATVHQVAQKLLVDNWDDSGFAAFAPWYPYPLSVEVNITHIEINEFLPSESQPVQT